MALEIGLNREPGLAHKDRPLSTAQWMQHEIQRQLFWSIFSVDRFMSASTGRPPILQEEDCETMLPCDEDGWCTRQFYTESINKERHVLFNVGPVQGSNLLGVSTTISSEPLVDGNGNRLQLSCMANVYRGAALLGRLTVFINRKCRQRKLFTPEGPGSDFAQLDQAIDEWYNNFPAELQYTPANIACHRQRSMPYFCRFLLLHTLHNTMIVLLHRPALAQMDSSNCDNVQPHLRECYAASAAKCMRAVATVTELIGYIKENKVLISPFLTYLTYTVATIVVNSIFFGKGDDVYKSKEALAQHFSLLQNLRSYWAMADKLYFMIRDLYAMHTNFTRQQQQSTIPAKRTSWSPSTHAVSTLPCQSSVRQQEWPTFTPDTTPVQPPQSNQPALPIETVTYNTTPPEEPTTNNASDGSLRGMSLADLALSTADGVSSTNWILGDNSKNLAAAMQFLGGMPANNNNNPYYASNIPFTSAPQQWPSYDFSDLPQDPN
ncbi:hypothetical protein K492DRAFT_226575 [Lichtheimia hyalospora FSU 10163]|nr:hypothetical protein K492DRAFT_226575 [Lichtheimia hyalospora FSU 10163]